MNKQYKILIPKAGKSEKDGGLTLYELGTIVTADESWKADLMESFVSNGWAMEVKMQDSSGIETKKKSAPRKRAAPKK